MPDWGAAPDGSSTHTGPVRVGDGMREPRKLRDVRPAYPELARRARIQGTVVLACVIGVDGRVSDVRVVDGPALLREAAAAAVRQWTYTPTLLGGVPVAVALTVTFRFELR